MTFEDSGPGIRDIEQAMRETASRAARAWDSAWAGRSD